MAPIAFWAGPGPGAGPGAAPGPGPKWNGRHVFCLFLICLNGPKHLFWKGRFLIAWLLDTKSFVFMFSSAGPSRCPGWGIWAFFFNTKLGLSRIHRRLGGESNWEIVSFRLCVRTRGLVVEWNFASNVRERLSLFPLCPGAFPFSLF